MFGQKFSLHSLNKPLMMEDLKVISTYINQTSFVYYTEVANNYMFQGLGYIGNACQSEMLFMPMAQEYKWIFGCNYCSIFEMG